MWDLSQPGVKPVSLALQGGFLTTGPPVKPWASPLECLQLTTWKATKLRQRTWNHPVPLLETGSTWGPFAEIPCTPNRHLVHHRWQVHLSFGLCLLSTHYSLETEQSPCHGLYHSIWSPHGHLNQLLWTHKTDRTTPLLKIASVNSQCCKQRPKCSVWSLSPSGPLSSPSLPSHKHLAGWQGSRQGWVFALRQWQEFVGCLCYWLSVLTSSVVIQGGSHKVSNYYSLWLHTPCTSTDTRLQDCSFLS